MKEPTLSEISRKLDTHIQSSLQNSKDIKDILRGQNEKLEKIEIQTVKTNGRVNRLEEDSIVSRGHVDSLRLWRNLLIGGGIVIAACGVAFLKMYQESVVRESAKEVVTQLEAKYDLEIR